jgi:hypothetical protein
MTVLISVEVLTDDELEAGATDFLGVDVALDRAWPPPKGPGTYRWASRGTLYVGSAKSLLKRLGDELRWIEGYDPDCDWSVTVVHGLRVANATPAWIASRTHAEAQALERHLIEWHRAYTGAAPPLVGWEAKEGSRRWAAQEWARTLYDRAIWPGRRPMLPAGELSPWM